MTIATTSKPAALRDASVSRVIPRLVAFGFALGALEHFAGGILLLFGVAIFPAPYPGWRHVVMALVDATIVAIAIRRPGLLMAALAAFLIEQIAVNGPFVWREATAGRFEWGAIATIAFVCLALAGLALSRAPARSRAN